MASSQRALKDAVRMNYLEKVANFLASQGEEILRTGSNSIAIPTLDGNKEECFLEIKFSVPTGGRDGEPFDGYSMAQAYKMRQDEKMAKAEENKRKKQQKIEEQQRRRAEKKALHNQEQNMA